jgi:hypothetical protein
MTLPFINYQTANGKICKLEKHNNSKKHAHSLSIEKLYIQVMHFVDNRSNIREMFLFGEI